MMVDLMSTYGADAFVSRVSAAIQGSTDTTFYILAVYFGSVGVVKTRYAVPYALLADAVGSVAESSQPTYFSVKSRCDNKLFSLCHIVNFAYFCSNKNTVK